jgi:hypothetical protein
MEGHDRAENAEDDVRLPLDVGEGGSNEIGERKVEDPVAGCGKTDAFGAVFEGEDFGGVDPGGRGLGASVSVISLNGWEETHPGQTIYANKDIGAGNDALSGCALDLPAQVLVAVDLVDRVAVGGHDTGYGVMQCHADDRAGEEQQSTADTINVWQNDASCDEEDDILNGRRVEDGVTGLKACQPTCALYYRRGA